MYQQENALLVQARPNSPITLFATETSGTAPAKPNHRWTLFALGGLWVIGLVGIGAGRQLVDQRLRQHHPPECRERGQELILRNRQLAAFHKISEVMQADDGDPKVFNTIAREISELSGFPIVRIELCDFERSQMILRGSHGFLPTDAPAPFEMPMNLTLSGEVARTGKVLADTDVSSRPRDAIPFLKDLNVHVFLCAPIRVQGQVAGTLSLAHSERVAIEPPVVQQVETVANYLAALFARLTARGAVQRGEVELAAVYDRAPSVLCLFDEQLRIIRANRAAFEFARRDKPTLQPMSAGEFFHCPCAAQSAGRPFARSVCQDCELCRAVSETFRTGKGWQRVRVKKLIPRGEKLEEAVVLLSTERIQVDVTMRVLMCLEDVTHTERADEQIRSQAALLDITRDAILVRDFSDRILFWNEGAHRLYGWRADEVLHRTMSEVLLGTDLEPTVEALRTVRDREDWTGEMKHRTRAGNEIVVQSRWTLVRERNGDPKAILVVSTDITEKKRLEAQLLRAQRLESVGTLASGLAHDLNNVLAPIMMATQFLTDEATDEATRTWLQTLTTCARRGADIVRQVLMFARGVEGLRIIQQPKHLVQEMERIARETFPKSIEIVTDICKQPWPIVGDTTQLHQVLMNLCVNARDAMPDGGTLTLGVSSVRLDEHALRTHPKAHPGPYTVLSVADTGTGIPPGLMDKIFDPFFTTKPLGEGTGLGLPSVMGIAESHGGFVVVESEINQGAVFRVYLPAAPIEKKDASAKAEDVVLPKGNGELILVVDDEPAIRKITQVILTKSGFQTLLAVDGREAVELFKQHKSAIKIVITDLMMPKMDGPATIRALRKIRPGIKTITITGLGEETRVAEAKAAGCHAFLNKPFTSDQLMIEVGRLLK
jgi:PAS domain S-box-containing protein